MYGVLRVAVLNFASICVCVCVCVSLRRAQTRATMPRNESDEARVVNPHVGRHYIRIYRTRRVAVRVARAFRQFAARARAVFTSPQIDIRRFSIDHERRSFVCLGGGGGGEQRKREREREKSYIHGRVSESPASSPSHPVVSLAGIFMNVKLATRRKIEIA